MTDHPVLFVIGAHGSGKSTLGRTMQERHGWRHLSVGDLGRLGRRGKLPRDISLRLMLSVANAKPGGHMDIPTASLLLCQVDAWRRDSPVIVDGFPSLPTHLDRFPPRSAVVYVHCDGAAREARLLLRSEQTCRKWTPGLSSERDLGLQELLRHARKLPRFKEVDNNTGLDALAHNAAALVQWSKAFT